MRTAGSNSPLRPRKRLPSKSLGAFYPHDRTAEHGPWPFCRRPSWFSQINLVTAPSSPKALPTAKPHTQNTSCLLFWKVPLKPCYPLPQLSSPHPWSYQLPFIPKDTRTSLENQLMLLPLRRKLFQYPMATFLFIPNFLGFCDILCFYRGI